MASVITHYKVFIASPGGLEVERKSFKSALLAYNDQDATERGCYYQPVGWEVTLGGSGRPQEKINDDLRKCDYFVLVLWNRWGSPTGKSDISSGTHEEFMLACELLSEKTSPMKEIVVFFRGVDPAALADPGPQLQKVLDFRNRMEAEKEFLFESFDSEHVFSERMKWHLSNWTRGHERNSGTDVDLRESAKGVTESESGDANHEVASVADVASTDTERRLAFEVTNLRSMEAFDRYGRYLIGQSRYVDAERIYHEMSQLASDSANSHWSAVALDRLASTYRAQGNLHRAEEALNRSVNIKREMGDHVGVGMSLRFLADLHSRKGRPDLAAQGYLASLAANPSPPGEEGLIIKYRAGRALADSGDLEGASMLLADAHADAKSVNNRTMMKSIKQIRKSRSIR